jgi:hypothetical protein
LIPIVIPKRSSLCGLGKYLWVKLVAYRRTKLIDESKTDAVALGVGAVLEELTQELADANDPKQEK